MAFCSGLVIPVLPLYARSFEVSYSLVGVVLAAQGVGTLVSDVPTGALIRRLGYKKVMLLGAGFIVLGALALVWARSLAEVVAYRVLSGVGMAMWGISRHAYVAEIIQVRRRGRSIAALGGIGRIGIFLGPVLGGTLAEFYGLRIPFFVYAAGGLLALVAAAVWVEGDREVNLAPGGSAGQTLWEVLRAHFRSLLTAGSGQLFAQMIRTARHVIVPLYAVDVIGLNLQSMGLIISIASALDMLMFYPAGLIMDRLGRKWASVPSFSIQALGMLLIPLASSFSSLLLAALVIGLGNGLGSGAMMTLGADLAPPRARGEFLGFWRFIGDVGNTGSPLVVGSIADLLDLAATPLVIAAIGVLGAGILGLAVPETLKREEGG